MKIYIEVEVNNAAFEENENELRDVLSRQDWTDLKEGQSGRLRDSNGNTVGKWEVNEIKIVDSGTRQILSPFFI